MTKSLRDKHTERLEKLNLKEISKKNLEYEKREVEKEKLIDEYKSQIQSYIDNFESELISSSNLGNDPEFKIMDFKGEQERILYQGGDESTYYKVHEVGIGDHIKHKYVPVQIDARDYKNLLYTSKETPYLTDLYAKNKHQSTSWLSYIELKIIDEKVAEFFNLIKDSDFVPMWIIKEKHIDTEPNTPLRITKKYFSSSLYLKADSALPYSQFINKIKKNQKNDGEGTSDNSVYFLISLVILGLIAYFLS